MKFCRLRPGMFIFLLSLFLTLWGCSSSPEEGEELENSENAEEMAENENEEGDENLENGEEGGDEEYADEGEEGGDEEYADEGEEGMGESEADLQEIISELNENTEGADMAEGSEGADVAEEGGNYQSLEGNDAGEAPADMAEPVNGTTGNVVDQGVPEEAPQQFSNSVPEQAPVPTESMGGVLPEMNSKMPYIVQRGDTLAKIAAKIYGSADRWQAIQDLTKLDNPNRIYPGDVVYYNLTGESQSFAQAYASLPRRSVVVEQGDTLSTISSRVYGTSKAWKFIWRQNGHIDNPDFLQVGQEVFYIEYQEAGFAENMNSNTLDSVKFTAGKFYVDQCKWLI